MRKFILTLAVGLMMCSPCLAAGSLSEMAGLIPDAKLIGQSRYNVLFWDVYDIALIAPEVPLDRTQPFALVIDYHMDIEGVDLANRSVEEIRALGYSDEIKLAAWHQQLRNIYPDVKPGTRLIGLNLSDKETQFYMDGKLLGHIADREFTRAFFDIWLSERTREPGLRQRLLSLP